MPKVVINNSQGLKVVAGSGVEASSDILLNNALYTGNAIATATAAPGTTLSNAGPVWLVVTTGASQQINVPAASYAGQTIFLYHVNAGTHGVNVKDTAPTANTLKSGLATNKFLLLIASAAGEPGNGAPKWLVTELN